MQRLNAGEVKQPTFNTNNHHNTSNASVDALPKQFIASMKTLFDILDDKQTGFVRYVDIEKGWQDDGCKGLPRGVLDSLRKVTPANGLLSFERFCAGLKLCLLRNQAESINTSMTNTNSKTKSATRSSKSPRSPSAPLQETKNILNSHQPTATVRPRNHALKSQRAISLPQLSPDSSEQEVEISTINMGTYNSPPPPPKPPRAAAVAAAAAAAKNANFEHNHIRNALQNWQMGLLLNEMDASEAKCEIVYPSNYIHNNRGSADGGSSTTTDSMFCATTFLTPTKKGNSQSLGRRREPRRHTLQNGIDYNMLRRLRQYEEEREVLLLGLDAIEKTRDWYLKKIAGIQERMRRLGRMDEQADHWSEAQQERLCYQRNRVLEVNRNLVALVDSWEHSSIVPRHFNLAINSSNNKSNNFNDCAYLQTNENRHRHNNFLAKEIATQRKVLYEPQHTPLRVSQSLSSPACSASTVSGGLIDADIVY